MPYKLLLTEEEILYHWTLPSLISSTEYGALKAVAKAQLKKVVEWIDSFNGKPVGEEVRYFIDRFRQALLDEVKDATE